MMTSFKKRCLEGRRTCCCSLNACRGWCCRTTARFVWSAVFVVTSCKNRWLEMFFVVFVALVPHAKIKVLKYRHFIFKT